MTAPAPRKRPAEDAHPAPTPAPVAVPEGALADIIADAIMVSGTVRVQVVNVGTMTGFMRRESAEFLGYRIADAIAHTAPRPEPVVAPLPSEAVESAVEAMVAAIRHSRGRSGTGDSYTENLARNALTAALPHLRLVPEDDEDTVRVPRGHSTAGHCHDADGGLHHEPRECPGAALGCDGRCCS